MREIDYQAIFISLFKEIEAQENLGNVASYIPQLESVDENKLGIHLVTVNQEHYGYGDSNEKFSIQSIAKVLSLALAFEVKGKDLWKRVGVEPSGTSFNSLVQLEYEKGVPRNPFINAGAIVVCDVLVSHFSDPKSELLGFIRKISNSPLLAYSPETAESEKLTCYRNRALINLMKDFGNIDNDIEAVLDVYFYLCSIEMSCKELAETFLLFAANGKNPATNVLVISPNKAKRINAIMQLCGFYDEAGEFSFRVGLPGKSGVGGGIIAIHPGVYSVAVWSPKLNAKGNSYRGMKLLELLTTKTESSIF